MSSSEAKAAEGVGSSSAAPGAPARRGMDLQWAVRPNILALAPYRCARDDYAEGTLLDANENSFGPPCDVPSVTEVERYPDPYQWELKTSIAAFRGVRKEQIFLGVGSDEAIDMLIRIFCRPGRDAILITPPTYGMYKVCAAVNDVQVQKVDLDEAFQLRVDETLAAVDPEVTKIIFLCSPGNPTSRLLAVSDVKRVLEFEGFKGVVVVDEAYVDFSAGGHESACSLLDAYDNLVVLQTCSKSFGLAGIRLGMAFGSPALVDIMNKVKAPYNVSKLAARVGRDAFAAVDVMKEKVEATLVERAKVAEALGGVHGVQKVHPSDTNFLLFVIDDALAVYKRLADEFAVVVRYRGDQTHCDGCLRVTIGTPEENERFLSALRTVKEGGVSGGSSTAA
eukprot:g2803.t1